MQKRRYILVELSKHHWGLRNVFTLEIEYEGTYMQMLHLMESFS